MRGVKFGRPERPVLEEFADIVRQWKQGRIEIGQAVGMCNMNEATFYRRLREYRAAANNM